MTVAHSQMTVNVSYVWDRVRMYMYMYVCRYMDNMIPLYDENDLVLF